MPGAADAKWQATKGRPYGVDGASGRVGSDPSPLIAPQTGCRGRKPLRRRRTLTRIGGRFVKRPYGRGTEEGTCRGQGVGGDQTEDGMGKKGTCICGVSMVK